MLQYANTRHSVQPMRPRDVTPPHHGLHGLPALGLGSGQEEVLGVPPEVHLQVDVEVHVAVRLLAHCDLNPALTPTRREAQRVYISAPDTPTRLTCPEVKPHFRSCSKSFNVLCLFLPATKLYKYNTHNIVYIVITVRGCFARQCDWNYLYYYS